MSKSPWKTFLKQITHRKLLACFKNIQRKWKRLVSGVVAFHRELLSYCRKQAIWWAVKDEMVWYLHFGGTWKWWPKLHMNVTKTQLFSQNNHHHMAKLEAVISKTNARIKKHKHHLFSSIQRDMELRKPRGYYCFCSKAGSHRVLRNLLGMLWAPGGLASSGAALQAQLHAASPGWPWQHYSRVLTQVHHSKLCQTRAGIHKTRARVRKEPPI